jgi:hypothetical protein
MKVRIVFFILFLGFVATFCVSRPTLAQGAIHAGRVKHKLSLYEKFEGTATTAAVVSDVNTTLGYDLNSFFGVDVGVPVYFVTPPPASKLIASQTSGIGNAYTDFRFTLNNPLFDFTSTPSVEIPTGDTSKGFSTGHIGLSWDNEIERSFGRFTPFLDVVPGNGLNNIGNPHTRIVHRSLVTFGKEAQFTAGSDVDLFGPFSLTADAYDVEPWGQQEIFTRTLRKETVTVNGVQQDRYVAVNAITKGGARLVKDNGYDAAIDTRLGHYILVEVGYDYSVQFADGTAFFSVGFDLSRFFGRGPLR